MSHVRTKTWDATVIAPDLIRFDTYEESLGDEWRGSVMLTAAEARRMATDLAMAAADAETAHSIGSKRSGRGDRQ